MKKQIKIVEFDSPEFFAELEKITDRYGGNSDPFDAILAQVRKPPSPCKTAVFEEEYVDEDYQDEFAAFYSKAFKKYHQRCRRIHFFAATIPRKTAIEISDYKENYLGFTILRPTDLQCVGRTVIMPKVSSPNHQFITCQANFKAHIFGKEFCATGMPFVQQDTQVGACAQASLWMLARYMSQHFNCREYLPSEINSFAKSKMSMGRALPADKGLTEIQILDALQGMGLPAELYHREFMDGCSNHIDIAFPIDKSTPKKEKASRDRQRTAKLADIAYRYIESGLPVILGTSDHAVVAVGHTYDHKAIGATVAIQRIPSFFINDDAAGPYETMPLRTKKPGGISFLDVDTVFTVAPPEVTLRGEQAETFAVESLERFLGKKTPDGSLKECIIRNRKEFGSWLRRRECRTYLMRSVKLQQEIAEWIVTDEKRREVSARLLVLDYPKYVWVTEVSSPDLLKMENMDDRQCMGFIITDSTAPSGTNGVMAMLFADLYLESSRHNPMDTFQTTFPGSTPFKHRKTRNNTK